jgi:hypothetical protein
MRDSGRRRPQPRRLNYSLNYSAAILWLSLYSWTMSFVTSFG